MTETTSQKPEGQTFHLTEAKGSFGMDGLTFTASVIGSIAWPSAAVVIAVLFRAQIVALLRRLREASWGDTKVSFADGLDKIENGAVSIDLPPIQPNALEALTNTPIDSRFQSLLTISPNSAIMDSWRDLEQSIRSMAIEHGLSENLDGMRVDKVITSLKSKGHLTMAAVKTLSEMRELRNRAAHNAETTVTDALRFYELAQRMKQFLGSHVY